ncbi:site-2 protease family protein [Streptomyces luteogriseus]|uniref:site-2 protease family protein n=2 Tax=Streptomyces luteogriseus TaxID=68233 RepID=UPI002E304B26|nr:site-2 protease family protein [Streptomyces luteogriseus]WTJ31598.1 site-2 protease family protein [Streptomyces luteogriseus]
MDESGGRGRPQSGNDESAERHAGPPARAAEPTPTDEQPTDERPSTPEQPTPGPEPTGPATPADTPATPPDTMRDESAADRPTRGDETPTSPAEPGASRPSADDSHPDPATAEDPHTTPARPDTDVPQAPPAPGEHDDGDTPEGDTHPDRAYASGPHSAPVAGRPETDRLHKAHTPAPDPGHPNHHPAPPAHGDRHLAHSAAGKGPAPQRPEPRGGLLMGRPFGVPVYVAPSWFLVAALITWVFGGQLERVLPELGAARYLVSLFFAVAFYASVLVHELAHTVAALRFKLPVRRIRLQFFGGVSEIEKEAETPGREFVLAFVGPLLSLVLAGIFYAAVQTVEPGTVPGVLLAGLMISNLIVAAFNLLPGLPLDGGRMLRAVVWKITGKPMKGTIAAAWVGRALAISVLIGLPLLTQSGALGTDAVDNVGMDTVLDALLAAILAAIIWTGAGNSLRMARLREHLPELRARALTRRAVPVESDTPLSEALRRANAAGARALVVVDPDGKPLSLVREAAIVGVPEHRRPWVAVSGLAQDLTDGMRVSAELSGEELLDALRATPATEYLVVEETGEIYGVLSAADVERAFVKAMARPS